jgi:glucose-1-phosphate adenylyltransferase
MSSMDEILAIILGGGRGSRLYPLTKMRSKPAVPMAGKYRLIDIPISNCINSEIFRIAVLTQFNSVSLHRHISRNYVFDNFHSGWVQIWAAEQTMQNADWYQGTADAVRKQLNEIRSSRAKYVLILAGDHLYRMDYAAMARFHWELNADITVAVQPVLRTEAHRFGILKRDANYKLTDFAEKPRDESLLNELVSREDPEKPFLGSMGIYMFRTETLFDLLNNYPLDDFGSHVIPQAIKTHQVFGFDFSGYWEDIGTIRSFYETNLALTKPNPPFDFYDATAPIYGATRFLPGTSIHNSSMQNVLLSEGCCIDNAVISDSIIGVRSQICGGVKIERSIMMGADYYERPELDDNPPVPMGIGEDCEIEGAIIDKNACIGKGVIIKSFPRGTDLDFDNWVVRDGIVVVPKRAVLMDGTYIGPGSKD